VILPSKRVPHLIVENVPYPILFSSATRAFPLHGSGNSSIDCCPIDLWHSARVVEAFDLAFQLGDPPARLIKVPDFALRLLWQACKLGQHSANRPRRRWRGEQMTLAGARMRGADLFRAEAHDPWLAKCRAECMKLALPYVA
jgi:hypothetical protein